MKAANSTAELLSSDFKVGILGGGQLGKMLVLAANNWDLQTWVLDQSADFPAGPVARHFVEGSFKDEADVYAFGQQVDVLTIEIEHVNTDALLRLQREGVLIHPRPEALVTIKDKGLQKQFYAAQDIPTAPFQLYADKAAVHAALDSGQLRLPFVQKSRTAGYDGRGVAVIRESADLEKLLPGPCVIEDLVDIEKEIAVVVARNADGQVACYPAVEMEFNPEANLVEFLFCPAALTSEQTAACEALACRTIEAYDICGLLAVELFLTRQGEIWVNEVAPRTHNSGHHSIDACQTSQFEQQLRAILNLPLGSTALHAPAVMVNLLGAPGHTGPVRCEGLADALAIEGSHLHLYGKKMTKPFRKMGHATVVDTDLERAKSKARQLLQTLKITAP
ncbi:MAG: 5-(carboxyamino)imidazole ribonucleotide synthase [Bacteroidota bacterium]